MARRYGPYDLALDDPISCRGCGWKGKASDGMEIYEELWDVSCPRCDRMLAVVPFPTVEDARKAAAAGNPQAQKDLPSAEQFEAWSKRYEKAMLKHASQLPDLDEPVLDLIWDLVEEDDELYTTIRLGDRVIWRELAAWEASGHFQDVFRLLAERYGARFRSLQPTDRSLEYLYGDRYRGPAPDELNRRRREELK